jgi:ribosomal protein L7/L12
VEREPVFRELRELGLSPIEAIYVASRVLGLSLPEAKTAIYASTAWRDQQEDWQRLQSNLEE